MLRSIYITIVYLSFFAFGVSAPFVFGLGYVWVDTFTPQYIVYSILRTLPVSLIIAVSTVTGYFFLDRKSPPKINLTFVITILFAIWITLSTFFWAVAPAPAYITWTYAVKTLLFSAFMPYLFRSRVQIESFILIYIFSFAAQFVPEGLKTMISGGGYGINLGLLQSNFGLSEGATLAAVSIMIIPWLIWLRRHSLIVPFQAIRSALFIGLSILALASAMGTYERTGVVAMAVLGAAVIVRSKHKLRALVIVLVGLGIITSIASHAWDQRISTLDHFRQDNSALTRLVVWGWTLRYVLGHPLGGGFDAYLIEHAVLPPTLTDPHPFVVSQRAFHSIYFEVLGEHGWVGLALFLSLIVASFVGLQRVAKRTKHIESLWWCRDLAFALQTSLMILVTGGAFIGIAFQPMLYYIFALTTSITQYVRRVDAIGSRGQATLSQPTLTSPSVNAPSVGNWRSERAPN